MTKHWGPLGWATLHSVAALYPDNPTDSEIQLITRWIESFRMCIVCEKCKTHFTTLLSEYKMLHPDWNTSRKNLTLFVLRAHNTVNIRQISKPALSLAEAVELLKTNLPPQTAQAMRQSYIVHIRSEWGRSLSLEGITATKYIRELILAETEYWGRRTYSWADIEEIIRGESISPLASREKAKSGPLASLQPPQRPVHFTGPSARPRFSFLSR